MPTTLTPVRYSYRRLSLGGVIRYTNDNDPTHAASVTDATPDATGSDYVSECGWCWLNAPHTQAAHALKVAR